MFSRPIPTIWKTNESAFVSTSSTTQKRNRISLHRRCVLEFARDRLAEMFNVPIFEPQTTSEGEGRKSHHPPRRPARSLILRPFSFSTLSTDKTSAQFKDETRVKWIDRAPSWKAAAPTRAAVAAATAVVVAVRNRSGIVTRNFLLFTRCARRQWI